MAEIKVYPYLTISPNHVKLSKDWNYEIAGSSVNLDTLLQNWEPTISVEANCSLKLDLDGILKECGLSADTKLRVVIGWRSSGTMLRGSGNPVDLNRANSKQPIKLTVRVDGKDVARDLLLFAAIILITPGWGSAPLAAFIPGSVLWLSENRILLEDESHYFPTEIADFGLKQWDVPIDALWFLRWDPEDLHQIVFGDMQLYLNSAHPLVARTLVENQQPSETLQQILFFDVARNLIQGALANPEFVSEPTQYPDGTVGAMIYNIIREFFPAYDVRMLYEMSKNKNLFESILQHHLHFLRD